MVQQIDLNHENDTSRDDAKKSIADEVCSSDSVYGARNEAMTALEESIRTNGHAKKKAEEGLKACATCNYEAPRIANIILK